MGFSATGELSNIRSELRDENIKRQKIAMTKLIEMDLNATSEVSSAVVMDALHSRHAEDLGLKKLLYIFLSLNPMTVQDPGTFLRVGELLQRDMQPHNTPLVRAAAAKFMACLTEQAPVAQAMALLRDAIRDPDPFVRKTAILSATRLYRAYPLLATQANLADAIHNRLQDESPLVVVNAVAAMRELRATCGVEAVLAGDAVTALLQAMGEGSEWGQAMILDAIGEHKAGSLEEARSIVDRVLPSLNATNSAVVLGACRVLLGLLEGGQATADGPLASYEVGPKVAKALVRLLAACGADIQWTVLRSVKLVLQRWPNMMSGVDVRNFFLRYTDAPHIKLLKLDLLAYFSAPETATVVIAELREYATDVDPTVGRKAVGVLGVLGVKVEGCAEKVVSVLLDLISSRHSSTLQAVVPAMAMILRRFPGQFEAAVAVLCDALEDVEDVGAKTGMIWMVGEYCERMEGAEDRLEAFLDGWREEATSTRLALLTAAAKMHLKVHTPAAGQVVKLLLEAGNSDDSPDVRERALFYWRLLAHDPELARQVVMAPRPQANPDDPVEDVDPLDTQLVGNIPKLSALLGIPSSNFDYSTDRAAPLPAPISDIEKLEIRDTSGVLEPMSSLGPPAAGPSTSAAAAPSSPTGGPSAPPPTTTPKMDKVDIFDLMTGMDISPVQDTNPPPAAPAPGPAAAAVPAPAGSTSLPAVPVLQVEKDPLADLFGIAAAAPASQQAPVLAQAAAAAVAAPSSNGTVMPPQGSLTALFPGQAPAAAGQATTPPTMSAIFGATPPAAPAEPSPAAPSAEPSAANSLAPPEPSSSPTAAAAASSKLNSPFATAIAQEAISTTEGPFPDLPSSNLPTPPAAAAAVAAPPSSNPAAAPTPQAPAQPPAMPPMQQPSPQASLGQMPPQMSPQMSPQGPGQMMMMNGMSQPVQQQWGPAQYGAQNGPMSPMAPQQQYTGYQPQYTGYQPQYTGMMQQQQGYAPQYTGGSQYQPQYTGMMQQQGMDPMRMSSAYPMGGQFTGGPSGAMRPPMPGMPPMAPMQQSYNFGASMAFAPGQMAQVGQMGPGGYMAQVTGAGMQPNMGMGMASSGGLTPANSTASSGSVGYNQPPPPKVLLRQEDGLGLGIRGQFVGRRSTGYMRYRLELVNATNQQLTNFLIQFNHNQLGLAPVKVAVDVPALQPNSSAAVEVACCIKPTHVSNTTSTLQVAIKPEQWERAVYFNDDLPYHVMD